MPPGLHASLPLALITRLHPPLRRQLSDPEQNTRRVCVTGTGGPAVVYTHTLNCFAGWLTHTHTPNRKNPTKNTHARTHSIRHLHRKHNSWLGSFQLYSSLLFLIRERAFLQTQTHTHRPNFSPKSKLSPASQSYSTRGPRLRGLQTPMARPHGSGAERMRSLGPPGESHSP